MENFQEESSFLPDEFCAYIDGFNLYKGALEARPELKWLNLFSFSQALRPRLRLKHVYYFTAPLKERFKGDESPQRQASYLRVLSSQGVSVIRGKFRKNNSWQRVSSTQRRDLLSPSIPPYFGLTQLALNTSARSSFPDVPKAQILKMEEKGSDVNLASFMMRDVFTGLRNALMISGDSDLVTPVKFSVQFGADIRVAVPNRNIQSAALRQAATSLVTIHPSLLREHQLDRVFITSKGGNIVRPATWSI
jgi:hypothetical protein